LAWGSSIQRLFLLALAALLAGCASFDGRGLVAGQSTAGDVERLMGPASEQRTRADGEKWLYYPNQPFGRKVLVARLGPDERLIAVEQRLSEEYIAKLVPGQSRREDVLALFGQPYERLSFPRMDRDAWSWQMRQFGNLPASLNVQMSPDGVVREIYVLDENNKNESKQR
jgi:hypothetical protein